MNSNVCAQFIYCIYLLGLTRSHILAHAWLLCLPNVMTSKLVINFAGNSFYSLSQGKIDGRRNVRKEVKHTHRRERWRARAQKELPDTRHNTYIRIVYTRNGGNRKGCASRKHISKAGWRGTLSMDCDKKGNMWHDAAPHAVTISLPFPIARAHTHTHSVCRHGGGLFVAQCSGCATAIILKRRMRMAASKEKNGPSENKQKNY